MSEYGNLRHQDIVKIAKKNGFYLVRQRGSHAVYSDGRTIITIPVHAGKTLGKGLSMKLIKRILSK